MTFMPLDMVRRYCSQGSFKRFKESMISRLSHILVRNTIYKSIYDAKKPPKLTNDLNHREKGVISGISGGIATLVSHPFETIFVRKTADIGRSP